MSVNRLDLKSEHKYVSLKDDAIDEEKSKLDEYKKDYDIKHLVYVPNKHPTFFILRNVSAPQYTALLSEHLKYDFNKNHMVTKEDSNMFGMSYELFSISCKQIEENGKRESITAEEFSGDVLQEVGAVIMDLSKLGETEKK